MITGYQDKDDNILKTVVFGKDPHYILSKVEYE